ncbi:MAG: ABC transporter ATP-binding protein [Planctomycetia bacterium]|nr:ABC transporter ATP-binding protein [Planctomycetia bacterium]
MKNYFRAVRLTFKYKWTIFCSFFCAIILAVCWGGNITAVYPLVEISFYGDSVPSWLDKKIAETEKSLQEERQNLETDKGDEKSVDVRLVPSNKVQITATKVEQLERDLFWLLYAKPYVDRFTPSDPFMTIVCLMGIVWIGTVVKSIFTFLHSYFSSRIGELGSFELREIFFRKLLGYETNHFSQQGISDSMSRFTNDMSQLSGGLSLIYGKLVREPLKMIVCLIGAAIVSWQLLLFTCLFLPLVAFVIRWLAKALKRVIRNAMIEMAQMYGQIEETFRAIKIVKIFNRENKERAKFRRINKGYYKRAMKIAKYGSMSSPITECLGTAMMMLAVLVGAYLVLYQQTEIFGFVPMASRPISIGKLILFYGLLIGASDPARRLSDIFLNVQGAVAASDRIYAMIDRPIPVADVEHPKPLGRFQNSIVWDHVCYEYPQYQLTPKNLGDKKPFRHFWQHLKTKKECSSNSLANDQNSSLHKNQKAEQQSKLENRLVLKDISLEIGFGETVAIVGPSGCGKSTLLNLIPRFFDPTSGEIKIDSVSVKEIKMSDLRNQISLVTQEPILFNDTVFENIRYSVSGASREDVVEAAQKAYAHDFIMNELINGYETKVGPGGGQLSGGQRQRIALARAILKNPAIFLMDEATSQIDIRSEQYIHNALAEFKTNRTVIIVTHRLSAIKLVDRVIVMQDGVIENVGTHEELLRLSPFYAELWQTESSQSSTGKLS